MQLPTARTADLVEQEIDKELLIYDLRTNKAYNLNETSKNVFRACSGAASFADLKRLYKYTDDVIYLALDELNNERLLEDYRSSHFAGMTRREVVRRVGLASMVALPVIAGLVAPRAASAASCGDTSSDVNNCGTCGNVCNDNGGIASCSNGNCDISCFGSNQNCDGDPSTGCETDTSFDNNNCGACGNSCFNIPNAVADCFVGACRIDSCNPGYADCDGDPSTGCETETSYDRDNCGACGNVCNGDQFCDQGNCINF